MGRERKGRDVRQQMTSAWRRLPSFVVLSPSPPPSVLFQKRITFVRSAVQFLPSALGTVLLPFFTPLFVRSFFYGCVGWVSTSFGPLQSSRRVELVSVVLLYLQCSKQSFVDQISYKLLISGLERLRCHLFVFSHLSEVYISPLIRKNVCQVVTLWASVIINLTTPFISFI